MMPTSMPMYTTFFMPVADRPMMVAMSRKSGSVEGVRRIVEAHAA